MDESPPIIVKVDRPGVREIVVQVEQNGGEYIGTIVIMTDEDIVSICLSEPNGRVKDA